MANVAFTEAYRKHEFYVEIEGIASPGIVKVSGLSEGDIDVIEQPGVPELAHVAGQPLGGERPADPRLPEVDEHVLGRDPSIAGDGDLDHRLPASELSLRGRQVERRLGRVGGPLRRCTGARLGSPGRVGRRSWLSGTGRGGRRRGVARGRLRVRSTSGHLSCRKPGPYRRCRNEHQEEAEPDEPLPAAGEAKH